MAVPAVPIMLAAAAGVQAVGAIRSANAQSRAQEANARAADLEAAQTREQAAEQERRYRIQAQKRLGSIRALYGASGLTMEGSPTTVLEESAANAELMALDIRKAGERRAAALQEEARSSRSSAKETRTSGYLSAASSLLAAGARVPELYRASGRVASDDSTYAEFGRRAVARRGARLGGKARG